MVYRIEMENVSKSFGGIKALKNVSFKVAPGEIHALVGENGAGKSTLMKILSGAYQKDGGSIKIDGKPVDINSPKKGKDCGIGIVYQEFELAPDLSVAENILMSSMGNRFGIINWKKLNERALEIIRKLGFDLDPGSIVKDLNVAYQQVVEISKALAGNAKTLILDEPTAVLTPEESKTLFEMLYRLKEQNVSIVYISHRMEEVFQIADSITTMRDGAVTGTNRKDETDIDKTIELMIGRKLSAMFPPRESVVGEEVFSIKGLTKAQKYEDVSFSVKKGEVLGIAGLVGSGRSEVAMSVFGADKPDSGEIRLSGKAVNIWSPGEAVKKGIGLIPENRKEQGLILPMTVKENSTMPAFKKIINSIGIIKRGVEKGMVEDIVERLAIRTDGINSAVETLSGGNQQKVVVAKWVSADSKVVFFDEPTRGVDVGAKVEIYSLINEFAKSGKGVIMISSEILEIIGMCDRVIVFSGGKISGELSKDEMNEINIMKLAVGGEK